MHAHCAIQIAFGAEFGIRFRPSEREDWTQYAGAIIPSRQPHSMDATRVRVNVVLFVEPETREGPALSELYLHDGIAALPDERVATVSQPLFTAWASQRTGVDRRGATGDRRAHERLRALRGFGSTDSSDRRLHQAPPRSAIDARGDLRRGVSLAEPLSPPLRRRDRDGSRAVHPLASLCSRVATVDRRRVSLELRSADPKALQQRVLDAGLGRVAYQAPRGFYFAAPGGQVCAIVQA